MTTLTRFLLGILLSLLIPTAQAVDRVIYYHNDALGSPVVATNQRGEVVWRRSYTPYGEETNREAPNEPGYTGKIEEPDLGISDFGARWYDPRIGRFLAIDPVGFSPDNPQSFNRYAYVNNNPYKYVDPDGRYLDLAIEAVSLSLGAASFSQNFRDGNYLSATVDGVGVAIDFGLAWVPGAVGGVGLGIKAYREGAVAVGDVAKKTTTVIGRAKDLKSLQAGEQSLLDRLPNLGNPKANWAQNSGVLREEMRRGLPIRDASPGDTRGQFLNAERNLLEDRGWKVDSETNYWMPPPKP